MNLHRKEFEEGDIFSLHPGAQRMDMVAMGQQEMKMQEIFHLKPHDLLLSAEPIAVAGFENSLTVPAYLHGLRDDILKNALAKPDSKEIILLIGSAGSGKTFLARQLAHWLYYGQTIEDLGSLSTAFENNGNNQVLLSTLDWGESFLHLPPDIRMNENINYYQSQELYNKKRREVQAAAHIWEMAFQNITAGYFAQEYRERNPRLEHFLQVVFADHVGGTGLGSSEQYGVGIDRATIQLGNLVHHRGRFSGLDYNVRFIGIITPPEVLKYNREKRARMRQELLNDEFIAENGALQEEAFTKYLQEAASQKEIDMLEKDITAYREWRWSNLNIPFNISDEEEQLVFIADFLTDILEIPKEVAGKSIFFRNYRQLDSVIVPAVLSHRPLEELIPLIQSELSWVI